MDQANGQRQNIAFVKPYDDTALIRYFKSIEEWHGYVRLLGLPQASDNPDISIDCLFVKPLLAQQYVSPDSFKEDDKRINLLDGVKESKRIVILGDPGSGKSTLADWIIWQFTRPLGNEWTESFGPLVPLPMVLREMRLEAGVDWKGLLASFLQHTKCKSLQEKPELVSRLLETGQAFIILDGLDEVGSADLRKALRNAVWEGMVNHPNCRWLLTSRIVGYEEVPFQTHIALDRSVMSENSVLPEGDLAKVFYISPFSTEQISAFAKNWFSSRQTISARKDEDAQRFVSAIQSNPSILRLARVPNLLAMMALLYRNNAELPHGRALLYDKISEAYLESIDQFRGLKESGYNFIQKRRWLSKVAFEMQLRRAGEGVKQESAPQRADVVFDEREVRAWLVEIMNAEHLRDAESAASEFLDYIGRRSGLLLPRGEGCYAFVHLSFQEYFAATYLADQISSPKWLKDNLLITSNAKREVREASLPALKDWVTNEAWQETFVMLFEILSGRQGWAEELIDCLCKELFVEPSNGVLEQISFQVLRLLATISIDPHSGLSVETRRRIWRICWHWHLAIRRKDDSLLPNDVSVVLLTDGPYFDECSSILFEKASSLNSNDLSVTHYGSLSKLPQLATLGSLTSMGLTGFSDLSGLRFSASSASLRNLRVTFCEGIRDLSELSTFTQLSYLSVMACSELTSLEGIENFADLNYLALGVCEKLSNFEDGYRLPKLTAFLAILLPGMRSLRFLESSPLLNTVILINCDVQEFSLLSTFTKLARLSIVGASLETLDFCKSLHSLTSLLIGDCPKLTSISGISNLNGLRSVRITNCDHLNDYSPILDLNSLERFECDSEQVHTSIFSTLAERGVKTSLPAS